MKIKEILLELNVVNTDEIKKEIASRYVLPGSPEIQAWFNKQFYRWVINNEKLAHQIHKDSKYYRARNENYPGNKKYWWVKDALDNNQLIYKIEMNTRVQNQANRIYKWLFYIEGKVDFDSESRKIISKLPRLTVPEAIKKSNLHTKEMEQAQIDSVQQDKNYKVVMKFNDGYSVVKMLSGDCKDLEGDIMQNCITKNYKAGQKIILYSLRDPNNKAHVTIETIQNPMYNRQPKKTKTTYETVVIAIKGKQNRAPIAKYVPYIKAFISKFKFKVDVNLYKYYPD